MRKIKFIEGDFYHIYNRGVDKRSIFERTEDIARFLKIIEELNTFEPLGGIHVISSLKKDLIRGSASTNKKLVEFVAYCLNQNHYHFILRPLVDGGVQKFMHRVSTGYTMYFNEKHKRTGSLFQGRYKAVHVETNEYLLHLSAYVNLNDRVHKGLNRVWMKKFPYSSFAQYEKEGSAGVKCNTKIILEQFRSRKEYIKYTEKVLPQMLKRKEQEKLLAQIILE